MMQCELSIIIFLHQGCALGHLLTDKTSHMGDNESSREAVGHCRRKMALGPGTRSTKEGQSTFISSARKSIPSQCSHPWRKVRVQRVSNKSMSSLSHPDFMGNDLNGWMAVTGWIYGLHRKALISTLYATNLPVGLIHDLHASAPTTG